MSGARQEGGKAHHAVLVMGAVAGCMYPVQTKRVTAVLLTQAGEPGVAQCGEPGGVAPGPILHCNVSKPELNVRLCTILHSPVGAAVAHMLQLKLSLRLFVPTVPQWSAVQACWQEPNGRLSQGFYWRNHVYSESTNHHISVHAN